MDENMSIEHTFAVIKKYFAFIFTLSLIFGMLVLAFTLFFMTPKYEAHTQILVSQSEVSTSFNNLDIETSLQLINTYGDIIESPIVLNDVIDNLELTETSEELASKINIVTGESSQVINITVTDEQQPRAAVIANELSNVFQEKVTEVMSVDNVSVLAPANSEDNPVQVSPDPVLNTIIGLFIGAVAGIVIAFLRTYLDRSVKTPEAVEKYLGLPVLGVTTKFEKKGRG